MRTNEIPPLSALQLFHNFVEKTLKISEKYYFRNVNTKIKFQPTVLTEDILAYKDKNCIQIYHRIDQLETRIEIGRKEKFINFEKSLISIDLIRENFQIKFFHHPKYDPKCYNFRPNIRPAKIVNFQNNRNYILISYNGPNHKKQFQFLKTLNSEIFEIILPNFKLFLSEAEKESHFKHEWILDENKNSKYLVVQINQLGYCKSVLIFENFENQKFKGQIFMPPKIRNFTIDLTTVGGGNAKKTVLVGQSDHLYIFDLSNFSNIFIKHEKYFRISGSYIFSDSWVESDTRRRNSQNSLSTNYTSNSSEIYRINWNHKTLSISKFQINFPDIDNLNIRNRFKIVEITDTQVLWSFERHGAEGDFILSDYLL